MKVYAQSICDDGMGIVSPDICTDTHVHTHTHTGSSISEMSAYPAQIMSAAPSNDHAAAVLRPCCLASVQAHAQTLMRKRSACALHQLANTFSDYNSELPEGRGRGAVTTTQGRGWRARATSPSLSTHPHRNHTHTHTHTLGMRRHSQQCVVLYTRAKRLPRAWLSHWRFAQEAAAS